jgi:hypothetical protein
MHSKDNDMEPLNELATALAKAQGEYTSVGGNRENTFFKSSYADMDAIIAATRPALSKYGLSFVQFTKVHEDGIPVLCTRLLHSSGQYIDGEIRVVPDKNDIQTFGKVLTYQKRYAAMAMLGVSKGSDADDDDGMSYQQSRPAIAKQALAPWQTGNLIKALEGNDLLRDRLLKAYSIETVEELDPSKYTSVMEAIARNKQSAKAVNNS